MFHDDCSGLMHLSLGNKLFQFVFAEIVGPLVKGGRHIAEPVYGYAAALHAAKPRHLPFGKLVDGRFEAIEHCGVVYLAGDVECDIFVFQAIIDERLCRYTFVEQVSDFVDHTAVEALFESGGDALAPGVAVYADAQSEAA